VSERPNINRPEFDEPREHEGFRARRARLGHQVGSELLGASLWEIDPGQAAYPYHVHLAEEELLVVLAGRPSLRTPEGWREVDEGEVLWFPRGEAGAHELVNRTDSVVRFLAFSTQLGPDVVLQPDSGKVGAFERRPRGGGLRMWFHPDDARGYYDGEAAPDSRSE
jgi:uncharacterized cupin superfamily protein